MAEQPKPPAQGEPAGVRFEAVVAPGEAMRAVGAFDAARVDDLDVDRVPDPEGQVRVVVGLEEVSRLLDAGFEVRLQRAVPVRPLDPSLVAGDEDVRAWFERRVGSTRGPEQS